ncbi:unnamed protein product [Lathyrus oleraceus]
MGRSVNNPLAQVLGDTQQGAEKAEAETEPLWNGSVNARKRKAKNPSIVWFPVSLLSSSSPIPVISSRTWPSPSLSLRPGIEPFTKGKVPELGRNKSWK